MRPIFNKNFVEKKMFMGPVNSAWDPLDSNRMRFSTKIKKGQTQDIGIISCIQTLLECAFGIA